MIWEIIGKYEHITSNVTNTKNVIFYNEYFNIINLKKDHL